MSSILHDINMHSEAESVDPATSSSTTAAQPPPVEPAWPVAATGPVDAPPTAKEAWQSAPSTNLSQARNQNIKI